MLETFAEHDNDIVFTELHHRLFNSYQSICSVLARCGRDVDASPALKSDLTDLGSRIGSMASLHRTLSLTAYPGRLAGHCQELCTELIRSFGREDIIASVSMDDIFFSPLQQQRIALLIVELATNSLKHSLIHDDGGTIWVDLKDHGGCIELIVRDSGGSEHVNFSGSRIAMALATSLSGNAEVLSENGYCTRVRFPVANIQFRQTTAIRSWQPAAPG